MSTSGRFVSGSYVYDLAEHNWKIVAAFQPPSMSYEPLIASGTPSNDYAGGDLVAELAGDVRFELPLKYTGDSPKSARRGLEAFLRRGVEAKNLQLQLRDSDHTLTPLWGQWGAWQTFEIIYAGSLTLDDRLWRFSNVAATLAIVAKPAIIGQRQQMALAKGNVAEVIGSDGLHAGTVVPKDDNSSIVVDSTAINADEGTIVVVWESDGVGPPGAGKYPIFAMDSGLLLYFELPNSWEFTDNVNIATKTGVAFPNSDTLVCFHCTYGAGGIALYYDGSLADTDSFTAFTPDDLFILSDLTRKKQLGGTLHFICTYDTAMTATEVAGDYLRIMEALEDGPTPSPLPYVLNDDGDGAMYNCLDDSGSTDYPHQNYVWMTGIAGSLPAKLEMRLQPSVDGDTFKRIALSLVDYPWTFRPLVGSVLYQDLSGSADVNSSGGAYLSTTVNTSFTAQVDTDQSVIEYRVLAGRAVCIYSRLQSGSTGNFQIQLAVVVGDTVLSAKKPVADGTAFRLVRTPFLTMPAVQAAEIADESETAIQLYAGRSTGSGTALFDYGVVMARPLVEVDTGGHGALGVAIYEATANRFGGSGVIWANLTRRGDVLRPKPHRANLLMQVMGSESVDPLISWNTGTTSPNIYAITPRWSVL